MVYIDLVRIKRLKFLGTYTIEKDYTGGCLPKNTILGKTVYMYSDYELNPTIHHIIDDEECRMYMKYSSGNKCYSSWEYFKEK